MLKSITTQGYKYQRQIKRVRDRRYQKLYHIIYYSPEKRHLTYLRAKAKNPEKLREQGRKSRENQKEWQKEWHKIQQQLIYSSDKRYQLYLRYKDKIRERERANYNPIVRHEIYLRNKYKVSTQGKAQREISLVGCKCEVCGVMSNLHRHHSDYSKPYEVKILCSKHHGYIHRKLKPLSLAGVSLGKENP